MERLSAPPTVAACHNDSLEQFYAKKRQAQAPAPSAEQKKRLSRLAAAARLLYQ